MRQRVPAGLESVPSDERSTETLYESATTHVFRQWLGAASVIRKVHRGPDATARLEREAGMLRQLAVIDGVVRLAEGLGAAGTLDLQDTGATALALLLRAGRWDSSATLALAIRLAATLVEVHRAGVVHRDINPANILVSGSGEPILIDFDLAVPSEPHGTRVDGVVGTLAYLAPEQTGRTGRAVDQRADLYSLGATLYEAATGQAPFEAADTLQLIHDHLVREPAPPSRVDARVPRGLSAIILRLLAKAPEQRYQSAEGLLHDLRRLERELEAGQDGLFELGERDFAARLEAPARLVGRDAEISVLAAAFAEAVATSCRTVLVEGAPGVGKTALVNELRPLAAAAGGWFVQGKFDQYQQDAAAADALTQALRALARLLLAQPRDELIAVRQRIMDRLGRNAGLIAALIPEFGVLLGPQPDVPELDPQMAEQRLQQTTVDLLAVIVSAQRPLVIVMDDLQWASAMSLRAFARLSSQPQLRGLLVVGAFRSAQADAAGASIGASAGASVGASIGAFAPALAQWRAQPQPPVAIALEQLASDAMTELAARMLRLPPERAGELARAVGAFTGGNPFDTVELLNALRRDGVLRMTQEGWRWETAAIRRFVGQGNVVDLLAARIARLPRASRELLESMSCLGNAVDRELLRTALGLDDPDLQERLRAPLEDGLLVLGDAAGAQVVKFRHDRVQQAMLQSIEETARAHLRLAMARRLASHPAFEAEAAEQYLASAHILGESREQRDAARLLEALARRLAMNASYLLAERYLAAAGALLAAAGEPAEGAVRIRIDSARHAALYSLARLAESDALYADIVSRTNDALDLVEPTCLQMRSVDMRGDSGRAMQLGMGLLGQLGFTLAQDVTLDDLARGLDALGGWVRAESGLDHAKRAHIRERRLLAAAKLLGRTVRPAVVRRDVRVIVWLLLEGQRLWAAHGPCPDLVASLGNLSGMLISLRGAWRTAFEVARHVLAVGEALGCEPHTSEARFIFSTYSCHWFEPVETMLAQVTRAYEGVKAGGDVSYAAYVHIVLATGLLEISPSLEAVADEVQAGIDLCMRSGNVRVALQHMFDRQLMRALRGLTRVPGGFDDEDFGEEAAFAQVRELPYVGVIYHVPRALCALVLGDHAALARHGPATMLRKGGMPGFYRYALAHFFSGMACAWQLQDDPSAAERPALEAELASCREWLFERARDQPQNYLQMARLVEAEGAWAAGERWQASTAFDAALAAVEGLERPWQHALIVERAGLFHWRHGLVHSGRRLLRDARDRYRRWGARAKVARMEEEHAFLCEEEAWAGETGAGEARAEHSRESSESARSLLERSIPAGSTQGSGTMSAETVDLMGVLRASRILSSETSLDSLTARVTEVVATLSGATRVLVLSANEGQWWLLAPGPGESPVNVAEAAQRGLLPLSAFAYVERTGEALVVDDAVRDDRFSRDPYFAGVAMCSLLVAPIGGRESAHAMLLLENRQGRAAFDARRLDAVMLIAGQLTVSLANAQLYERLEQRVRSRTQELERMQGELVATARRAGKAEIAANVLHNVGNVLNSVNVSAAVVRRTLAQSRVHGLQRAVELMNAHARDGDLGRFIEGERGDALLAYLNSLVETLRQEQQSALADLDRVAGSIEHISYVVATQQSHAGPSSLLEVARPQDLVEEALRLSAQALERFPVSVVRRYEDVPHLPLDKPRLLQILVNLIANAAQAMEGVARASRRLTLASALVREDGQAARLRISVADEGEGISADNLTRIFAHGFTTRSGGHGFGLHSSALAAMEMGGRLSVRSDGPGRGAEFTLELPIADGQVAAGPAAASQSGPEGR